jgi:hypothetical protein
MPEMKPELCEWDNKEEKIPCQRCGKMPDELYFVQDGNKKYIAGSYYCKGCANEKTTD